MAVGVTNENEDINIRHGYPPLTAAYVWHAPFAGAQLSDRRVSSRTSLMGQNAPRRHAPPVAAYVRARHRALLMNQSRFLHRPACRTPYVRARGTHDAVRRYGSIRRRTLGIQHLDSGGRLTGHGGLPSIDTEVVYMTYRPRRRHEYGSVCWGQTGRWLPRRLNKVVPGL